MPNKRPNKRPNKKNILKLYNNFYIFHSSIPFSI